MYAWVYVQCVHTVLIQNEKKKKNTISLAVSLYESTGSKSVREQRDEKKNIKEILTQ